MMQENYMNIFKRPDTEFGIFHADMEVSLLNDGPFTILLDSEELGYE